MAKENKTALRKARERKRLSQKQLAVISGVTQRMIECYEQRARAIEGARLDSLCRLALALDCRIEDILEDKDLIARYKLTK